MQKESEVISKCPVVVSCPQVSGKATSFNVNRFSLLQHRLTCTGIKVQKKIGTRQEDGKQGQSMSMVDGPKFFMISRVNEHHLPLRSEKSMIQV